MENRIMVITNGCELHKRCMDLVKQWAVIYETKGIQDALSYLTVFSYHLILVVMEQEPEFICQLVGTIRKLTVAPVMILLPERTKKRKPFIEAGADVVLEEPCEPEEIRLQAYALIRRYTEWNLKEKKEDGGIVIGPLKMNSFTRTLY